jgi:hypothetical protein
MRRRRYIRTAVLVSAFLVLSTPALVVGALIRQMHGLSSASESPDAAVVFGRELQ